MDLLSQQNDRLWIEPWPTRSRATVEFFRGERDNAERMATRLFGHRLRRFQYAGLAGAPDDALVEVGTLGEDLFIDVSELGMGCFRAAFCLRRLGTHCVIVNDSCHIHDPRLQGNGFGTRVFHRQLENARLLGVTHIITTAGRRPRENGYYTWPRLGFDGMLPVRIVTRLPPPLRYARRLLDLLQCETGRLWWKEHGCTVDVTFDVSDRSRSRLAFERYLLWKRLYASRGHARCK